MQEGRKRKMRFPKTGSVLFLCYVMLMLSEHVSMALSLRLSKILQPTNPLREEERVQPQERSLLTKLVMTYNHGLSACTWRYSTSFNEWIILRTDGQTWYNYFIPPAIDTNSKEDREIPKRFCEGFPCMYSHLGTKAGRASLYKTLAGFIDDCINDASCDPGRRKRSWMEAIKAQQEQEHVINSRLDRRFQNVKISRTLQKDREGDVS